MFRISVMRALDLARLPVDEAIPQLRDALRSGTSAVLVAPPGAGKTTRVPLALLNEPWLADARLLMLEPRRLAARAAAHYMAELLGEPVGETIGYRVRMESRVGPRTRIEVVTEGVLTRMLVDDPTLDGVNLVIFDEFHERSLNADVGLALTLHSRDIVRDDLRLLVMSATLDTRRVASLLGNAPEIISEGKSFPVATRYMPPRAQGAREATVLTAIERALRDDAGDVLVFLPGAGEINRVARLLNERALPPGVYVVPLHGALALDAQDHAIRASAPGTRKIVLATTIAQTSLTIDGVRVVIDSGLTRIPRYSVRSGMTRLETVTVSRSAADQRRGRAGRLASGVCYRLWDEGHDAVLREHDIPEILEADLTSVVLDLAAAGVRDVGDLRWLDPPPPGATARARELLRELAALDDHGALTLHGRSLAALGTHPRLGHMILQARGHAALACDLAAILEERDFVSGPPAERDPDIRSRISLLHGGLGALAVDRAALHRVRSAAQRWRGRAHVDRVAAVDADASGVTLAFAYPDRIAQRRSGPAPRYVLRNGIGAALPPGSGLHNEAFLVAAELDGRRPESLILLAAPIAANDLQRQFADQIELHDTVEWSTTAAAVVARRQRTLGAILLADDPLADPDPAHVQRAVRDAIVASELRMLNWTREASTLRDRLAFLHSHDAVWPEVSIPALGAAADKWLTPRLAGKRRLAQIQQISVADALLDLLTWQQRAKLDELAPTHVTVPSGSRITIDYSDPHAPVLAVRLQEVFGLTQTPSLLAGRVRLTLHLLSPSQRPVQVTTDLASFWRSSYFDVRKELRGRYPKHHWPDDPLAAVPTRRTKR